MYCSYPQLKSFLKDGEAESYKGITLTFIHGKTAVLTISKNGVKQEDIVLHTYKTKADMHSLFKEKGFVLRGTAGDGGSSGGSSGGGGEVDRKIEEKTIKNAASGNKNDLTVKDVAAKLRKEGGLLLKDSATTAKEQVDNNESSAKESKEVRKQRLEDERRYLGQAIPTGSKLIQTYVLLAVFALFVVSCTGWRHRSATRGRRAAALTARI